MAVALNARVSELVLAEQESRGELQAAQEALARLEQSARCSVCVWGCWGGGWARRASLLLPQPAAVWCGKRQSGKPAWRTGGAVALVLWAHTTITTYASRNEVVCSEAEQRHAEKSQAIIATHAHEVEHLRTELANTSAQLANCQVTSLDCSTHFECLAAIARRLPLLAWIQLQLGPHPSTCERCCITTRSLVCAG